MKIGKGVLILATLTVACALQPKIWAQSAGAGTIRGVVKDPSAAVIPGAMVVATGNGITRSVKTDNQGRYTVLNVPSGKYNIRVEAKGFVPYVKSDLDVPATQSTSLDVALQIATETQQVQVSDTSAAQLSTDASSNVSALVLKEEDLEQLPDDPDDLQSDLEALAGPAAGPNGAQFFIDGFSGGQLPPKSSIREIRINSNPFSAEYDTPGFGRIEILTKPGTDNFHGTVFVNYGDRIFDSRNPLLTTAEPAYSYDLITANVGGPLNKKTSFFLDFTRRTIDENALVVAQYVNPANPFAVTPYNQAVLTPNLQWQINPRIDYQLNASNTLVVRFNHTASSVLGGVGGFALPDQETQTFTKNNMVQITETMVIGTVAVDETRFQFRNNNANINANGNPAIPGIDVNSAFNSGGSPFIGTNYTDNRGYELTNFITFSRGSHAVKVGARVRQTDLDTRSTQNFNGSWAFNAPSAVATGPGGCLAGMSNATSLNLYQETQQLLSDGTPMQQVIGEGCGPSEFSLSSGIPAQGIGTFDLGAFVQDDWRVRPNFTVNAGLRYETQNNIHDHLDFAPRLGFAWAPGAKGKTASKTVLRGGYGIFFTRVADSTILQTLRFNGFEQTNYVITASNPNSAAAFLAYCPQAPACLTAPGIPALSSLTVQNQGIYTLDNSLRAPYMGQLAIGVDRQLPGRTQLSVNFINTRGVHILRERDINAPIGYIPPLPGSDVPVNPGIRPFAGTDVPNADGDIYQYETSGIFKQTQFTLNANTRLNSHLQLQGYYVYGQAHTNANGFLMNPYDANEDWGRSPYDVRNRAFIGGTVGLPFRLQVAPFILASSGLPFNITTGDAFDGDGLFNARPSFGTCGAAGIVTTRFGCFNPNPAPGATPIPIEYGDGPAQFSVNLRLSRTWGWGEKVTTAAPPRNGGGGGGGGRGPGGFGPRPGFGGGGRGAGAFGGGNTGKRYNLTATISARNAFNHVNFATPVGVLASPFFGESTAINNGNSEAGNRKIEMQLRFQF